MQLTVVLPGMGRRVWRASIRRSRRAGVEFPVFGATAGSVGCLGAMEAIKVLTGLGEPLYGKMLLCDLRDMTFRQTILKRRADCLVCGPGAVT